MRRIRRIGMVVAMLGVAGTMLATVAGGAPKDDVQAAKSATAKYHSLRQADAAGYVQAFAGIVRLARVPSEGGG